MSVTRFDGRTVVRSLQTLADTFIVALFGLGVFESLTAAFSAPIFKANTIYFYKALAVLTQDLTARCALI